MSNDLIDETEMIHNDYASENDTENLAPETIVRHLIKGNVTSHNPIHQ